MNRKKYIIFGKEHVAPVAILDTLPKHPDKWFIAPYVADWKPDTQLVVLLAHIGNRKLPTKLEILHDIQIDQATVGEPGAHLEFSIDDTNGGFESYANEALARLMEQLNQGLSTSRESQPHINFEFNNDFFQWAAVPV